MKAQVSQCGAVSSTTRGGNAGYTQRMTAPPTVLFALTAGLLTALTPCVYPMIPITISIFGAKTGVSRGRALGLATFYVAGIAFMFGTLGTVFALLGKAFGTFLANPEAVREEYVEGFGLSEAEYGIVRTLGAQGGRRFLVKQGHSSAICELDLAGLEEFVTVLSATTDNVALLDEVRARTGDAPADWLPILRREVHDRKSRAARRPA